MAHESNVKVTGVHNNALAEACATAVARCAEANACFTPKGLLVSEHCVSTISKQIVADSCLSAGFGLAARK